VSGGFGPDQPALSPEELERLALGIAQFNDRRFYECHDTLEELWTGLRGGARDLVQGLIQLAVGFYHLGNGNHAGAVRLFDRGLRRLSAYPDACAGLDLGSLRAAIAPWRAAAERGGALPEGGPPLIGSAAQGPAPRRLDRRALFASLVPAEPGGGHWIRVQRPAMACRFEVLLDSDDAALVTPARVALDEVDAIEAELTYFRETSELSRVNREAGREPVVVSPELFALLRLCAEIHELTGGAFDPTSTPLSRTWGFLAREGRLPEPSQIEAARAVVGFGHVELDPAARSVRFEREGIELNLGAVGKGWALDRVSAGLRAAGATRALLSAGGSSQRAWGPSPWEVALTSAGLTLGRLRLRDAALGTSGSGVQHFERDGRRYGHVIDPRTGWPADAVRSATAITGDAAVADALSTAFLVGGPAVAAQVCAARPRTLAILVLEGDPGVLRVFGEREGVGLDPADGYELWDGTTS
jgi:thiamine biosynthesis lipoprotein